MALFEALGINATVFVQFFIYIFTIFFLAQVALKHYAAALELRDRKTVGSEEEAVEISKKAADLSHQYESRAREVSNHIKTIFDSYRTEASKEYESILTKARSDSQKILDGARASVSIEVSEAARALKEEAPKISQEITKKLLFEDRVVS